MDGSSVVVTNAGLDGSGCTYARSRHANTVRRDSSEGSDVHTRDANVMVRQTGSLSERGGHHSGMEAQTLRRSPLPLSLPRCLPPPCRRPRGEGVRRRVCAQRQA